MQIHFTTFWLLVFGLYCNSYINAAFNEGWMKEMMDDEWIDLKKRENRDEGGIVQ